MDSYPLDLHPLDLHPLAVYNIRYSYMFWRVNLNLLRIFVFVYSENIINVV